MYFEMWSGRAPIQAVIMTSEGALRAPDKEDEEEDEEDVAGGR